MSSVKSVESCRNGHAVESLLEVKDATYKPGVYKISMVRMMRDI